MRNRLVLAVAGMATAVVVGCSALGRAVFKEPVVNFRDLKLQGIGLEGGQLDVVLSVYNPNDFKLEGTRLTYNLMIDSVKFGSGALDDRFTVNEDDSTLVHIPLSFTYKGIGAAGQQLIKTGTVNYRVIGDVTVKTPLGNFTRPYDRNGQVTAFGGVAR
jgi:LEA14-like dessication related protein